MARTKKRPSLGSEESSRPKTLQRRKELLGVVYEAVSESGVDGVTMRQIAEAADISTGTINYHFKNKHNLLILALEAAYELPEDWKVYEGSPFSQLQQLAMGYVFRSPRDRFWRFWINYTAHSTRDEEMRQHQNTRYERQLRFWGELLKKAVLSSEVDPEIDPEAEANELLLIAQGLVIRQIQSPTPTTREEARAILTGRFERLAAKSARKPARRSATGH
ncbi:TetR/AcrR family transcriptional regulator [Bradyrhizobium manausense]|uniref:TetR/AcrR family transcriptional regulator n=1 Tax=Bradyrhizobium manausense TaxID=989370 RepID=UPI001BA86A06|nr:TetR/AcrR family transcriptional regulator [Bradyrhizobium manausense]MBR0684323.1 TetR/AcrR family transcriptional regulator [Bradyrhizobium manausense]